MSLPPYPKYKNSGVAWLGEVPEGWDCQRLKNLLFETDQRAGNTEAELLGLSKSLGVVRRSELDQGAAESNDYGKYKLVNSGQLVMNKMQAWNGVFGLSPFFGKVSPDYATFQFIQQKLSSYLCLLFRTDIMSGEFFTRCRGMGTAFLRLNSSDFLDVKVPLPSLEEIDAITFFLDRETAKIDALIAEQEKLITLLAEKRQATISHAVTKGLDPNAPMKDSGVAWLGEVPEGWEIVPLKKYILLIDSGVSVNSIDIPANDLEFGVLKTSCVSSGIFNPIENKTVVQEEVTRVSCSVKKDSLIVSRMNTPALVGAAGLVEQDYPCLYLPDRLWQVKFKEISTGFAYYWTQSKAYRAQVEMACSGTSSSMQNLGQDQFSNFVFSCPPVDEALKIFNFLDAETARLDALSSEATRGIALLKERRAALISAAVTGKIDVREAV